MEQPLDHAELLRRAENVVRPGVVTEADYPAARVRVKVSELVTDWLPWVTPRAGGDRMWWAPEVGEQVTVVGVSADPAQAVVLPALFSTAFPAPEQSPDILRVIFKDGANMSYDRTTHILKICLPEGGRVEVCGDVIADGVSLKHHVHTGVEPGGGLSGPPLQ